MRLAGLGACSARTNTTAGRTWSATATKALLRSAIGLAAAMGARAGVCNAHPASVAALCLGRLRAEANARPKTKAMTTRVPNLSQSRVRSDIVISLLVKVLTPAIYIFLFFSSSTIS